MFSEHFNSKYPEVTPDVPLASKLGTEPVDIPERAVKAPVLGDVLPIAPGVANLAVTPAPETAPVAESVVKAPVLAVVAPIVAALITPPAIVHEVA